MKPDWITNRQPERIITLQKKGPEIYYAAVACIEARMAMNPMSPEEVKTSEGWVDVYKLTNPGAECSAYEYLHTIRWDDR